MQWRHLGTKKMKISMPDIDLFSVSKRLSALVEALLLERKQVQYVQHVERPHAPQNATIVLYKVKPNAFLSGISFRMNKQDIYRLVISL